MRTSRIALLATRLNKHFNIVGDVPDAMVDL